jgi:hypothetical protein
VIDLLYMALCNKKLFELLAMHCILILNALNVAFDLYYALSLKFEAV